MLLTNSFWDNQKPPDGRYYKQGPQRTATEPLLLLAELVIENQDGTVRRIGTDSTWRTHDGPLLFSHIYAGEDYDARRMQRGWDMPGFDDGQWLTARVVEAPTGELRPQHWAPVAEQACFAPASITAAEPGVWTYAFPQNCSAQVRIKVSGGKPGQRISLRCGEHQNSDHRLFGSYVVNCDVVTDGKPVAHQWHSFYVGMQFVEAVGAVPKGKPNPKGLPVIESLELVHVRTGLPPAGAFHCSSELINNTHQLIDWAIQSNMSHVLTDCPHREKLGWLETAYLLAPSIQYRYDCREWFDKLLRDIRDAQEPSGRVLTVAPSYPAGRFPDKFNWTVEWGAAAVILPWRQYEWTGDPRVLAENFDTMRRFVDFVGAQAKDGLAPGGLGDWYDYGHGHPPGPSRFTPPELTATATWAMCARMIAQAAEVLGRTEDARRYHQLYAQITADFQRHFRDPVTGSLQHNGSPQCANAIALCAGIVPEEDRAHLIDEIVKDLEERGGQQTPGDVGHVYFIRALAEAGRSDVLHRVYARNGLGSYGGILDKGLTSMPETWDAMMDGYQSLNHCMLGHAMQWFYSHVAGIRQRPDTVGWKDILIAPNPGPLSHAEATVTVPAGVIQSRWSVKEGLFQLEVIIPGGIKATARLPSGAIKPLATGAQVISEPWNHAGQP